MLHKLAAICAGVISHLISLPNNTHYILMQFFFIFYFLPPNVQARRVIPIKSTSDDGTQTKPDIFTQDISTVVLLLLFHRSVP